MIKTEPLPMPENKENAAKDAAVAGAAAPASVKTDAVPANDTGKS